MIYVIKQKRKLFFGNSNHHHKSGSIQVLINDFYDVFISLSKDESFL